MKEIQLYGIYVVSDFQVKKRLGSVQKERTLGPVQSFRIHSSKSNEPN